jgi:PAS domain S-box-containing protein
MLKIVLVDDHEPTLSITKILLSRSGYKIIPASNGADALNKIRKHSPDLVVSDILMPVMDGFTLCRELKKDHLLKNIPFVFISSTYVEAHDKKFGLSLGAEAFIIKTQNADAFVGELQKVIEKCTDADHVSQLPGDLDECFREEYIKTLNRKLQKKILQLEDVNQRLHESEENYRLLFENSIVGIFQSAPAGRFLSVNSAFARMLGYLSPEEFMDSINDIEHQYFVDPEDRRRYQELLQKSGYVENYEFKAKHKTEAHVWISKSARVYFDEDAIPIRHEGIAIDITNRKNLEKKLRQSTKMESIGILAGGIAHDFNNILSIILGYTELAIGDLPKGSSLEGSLQEIHTAGIRAKELIHQILAFSRQSREKVSLIQVDTIAKEALKFIRSSIPTSIAINQNIMAVSLIRGNPTQVHQIIMNLCTNAAYAMEEKGGLLEVSLKDVIIENAPAVNDLQIKPGEYIEIKVADTGSGIPENILDNIFEPYFTTKSPGEGTGLGLSVVHGIVESYGGRIQAESEMGKGSVFTIYLPAAGKRKASRSYESEELPSGTERILLIDDELQIATLGCEILKSLGYSVTEQTSSLAALELFRSKRNDFDLIITDMTMPNMTGDQLTVELKKIRKDIPIILCTGFSKKISDKTAPEIGINALIYKPVSKADLAKAVRGVLDSVKNR